MGTRTYSRRKADGTRVLTALGRARAGGVAQTTTPVPEGVTPRPTSNKTASQYASEDTRAAEVLDNANGRIDGMINRGLEVALQPLPFDGDYRLFDTKKRYANPQARNAGERSKAGIDAMHEAAKRAFSADATADRVNAILAELPDDVRNSPKVQDIARQLRETSQEIGNLNGGVKITFQQGRNPDVAQIKRMNKINQLWNEMARETGSVTGLPEIRALTRQAYRQTRLRAAEAIDLYEMQYAQRLGRNRSGAPFRTNKEDAFAETFGTSSVRQQRRERLLPSFTILPDGFFE